MEQSEEFQPTSMAQCSEQNYGRPKKQQKYVSGRNNGKWSQLQHAKYIAFIEHNKEKMRSKQKRRVGKLYKEMASFIQTRNPFQCRSHHQKLEDRHYFPNKIISHFKKNHDLTAYLQAKLQLGDLDPTTNLTCTLNVKLQDRNLDYHSPHPNTPKHALEPSLPQQTSTPTSPASNEALNMSAHASAFVNWQPSEANPFWGSYYFYPFYSAN